MSVWILLAMDLFAAAWDAWAVVRWRLHDGAGIVAMATVGVLLLLLPTWGLWRRKRWGWWLTAIFAAFGIFSILLGVGSMLSMKHASLSAGAGAPQMPTYPFKVLNLSMFSFYVAELVLLFRQDVLSWTTSKTDGRGRRAALLGAAGCLGPMALGVCSFVVALLVVPHLPKSWNANKFFGVMDHFSPFDHVEGTATLLGEGRVFLTGSQLSPGKMTAEFYSPSSDAFTRAPDMPHSRTFDPVAILLKDGKVLVAGGMAPDHGYVAAIDVFDPKANTWRTAGNFAEGTRIADAIALDDRRVLFTSQTGRSKGVLWFDITTGAIEMVGEPCMVVNGSPLASLLPDGKVLITHLEYGGPHSQRPNAFLFDPATRTTSALPRMAQNRSEHQATVLSDGRVLITGGAEGSPSAEVYDPKKGAFLPVGEMLMPRSLHKAIALADGRVLIVGGVASHRSDSEPDLKALAGKTPEEIVKVLRTEVRPNIGKTETMKCEIFDPRTNTFSIGTPPPLLALDGMGARTGVHLLLPDGRVLFMAMSGPVTFDPRTGTWQPLHPDQSKP
jgi:hypothetical protein